MMKSSKWRININIVKIVKLLKDYSKTPLEANVGKYFANTMDSTICFEEIKNKKFLTQYVKPIHDFIIYTTELPFSGVRRINC